MSLVRNEIVINDARASPLDGLIFDAREAGAVVSEIGVWDSGTIHVEDGEVGMIATDQLNGCHVTVVVAATESGHSVSMTHFPPEIGAERYEQALTSISADVQPSVVVTFTAIERPVPEDSLPSKLFPSAEMHSLYYQAKNPKRARQVDAGRCMAIIDNESDNPSLHIVTDSGDRRIFLS